MGSGGLISAGDAACVSSIRRHHAKVQPANLAKK
jgi:hypothetical protein